MGIPGRGYGLGMLGAGWDGYCVNYNARGFTRGHEIGSPTF